MRKLLHYGAVLALVLVSTTSFYAPPAHGLPQFSTLTDYYDSNLNGVGYSFRSCSGSWEQSGTLAGVWKEVDRQYCDYPWDFVVEYYHYCNGAWVQVSSLGDPSC